MATQSRVPTGDGVAVNHVASAGAAWQCIDDPIGTPDDDTTFISATGASTTSYFTFSAFTITATTVAKLTVVFRGRNNAGNSTLQRSILRVNATQFTVTASSNVPTSSYADYTFDFLTNPETGSAWTQNDINGTGASPLQEFGFRNQNNAGAEVDRCTQIYATVDYTTFIAQPNKTLSQAVKRASLY